LLTEEVVIKFREVEKWFGATQALDGVDLDIQANEVHAIVGSNGAGKSTLMKTLAGEYKPDHGTLHYLDEDITGMVPLEIQRRGIQVVHQVLNIVESMSILENILLASPPTRYGILNWKSGREKVKETLDFIGIEFDLDKKAGSLSISEQQFVIIARAIINEPKVLIFDEPTSRISLEETENLYQVIRKLKALGTTTVYISHRIEEIYQICDRISVFRNGKCVATRSKADLPKEELVTLMLGKDLDVFFPKNEVEPGGEILSVENLNYEDRLSNVSFSVRRGEIVSIVGAVGSGKTEIINSVFGIITPSSGDIKVDGQSIFIQHTPQNAIKSGVALIPEDRALQGMIGDYSVKNNLSLVNLQLILKNRLLNMRKENGLAQKLNDLLSVTPRDINYQINALSGGNQQKVVIGKWLAEKYKLYLLDEVSAGVDIGAKSEIYQILGDLINEGAGVLLATGDIEEAIGISDRIIILYKGRIVKQVTPQSASKDEILFHIMGGEKIAQ
jgi:ABC-type sugar transport system ATPase subunit